MKTEQVVEETVDAAPAEETQELTDPSGMSTAAYLDSIAEEAAKAESSKEKVAEDESSEKEEDESDGPDSPDPDDDEDLSLDLDGLENRDDEIEDEGDAGFLEDDVLEALADKPEALKRYKDQAKGFEKLRGQVETFKVKAEDYDMVTSTLLAEDMAPQGLVNLIDWTCKQHGWDEGQIYDYLAQLSPARADQQPRNNGQVESQYEARLRQLEAQAAERQVETKIERFVAEKGDLLSKRIAREYAGYKVTPGMIKKALLAQPNLRENPIEAVEFHYRKEIVAHSSNAKAKASEVRGHEVPQSQKGVAKKLEKDFDPKDLSVEQLMAKFAQQV